MEQRYLAGSVWVGLSGQGGETARVQWQHGCGPSRGFPAHLGGGSPHTLCSATAAEASPVVLGAVPGPKSDSMENLFVPKYPLISGLLKYNGHPAKLPCLCSQFYISEQTYIVL